MSAKTPAIISAVIAVILLVLFAVVSVLLEMAALNGVSESQGITAITLSLVCHGVAALLLAVAAWWLTHWLISRFNLNKVVAVLITVMMSMLAGGTISFLSIIISIPLAGIR